MNAQIVDRKKYLALGQKLIDQIKDLFPSDTQYLSEFKEWKFTCIIHWKLNNDKDRPDKLSRSILIRISYEYLSDCNYEKKQRGYQSKI